ncbi:glycosyltransferase [Kitasatospora sp. NPDC048365]|uniref:glycosyltransferase n=1 Tax=Kitasatospora sp. NPDC048365 TaxID=3364050 RepID=UPI00371C90A0
MNGSDRRAEAACPRFAVRDSLYTPVRVVELDLDEPGELRSPGGSGPADPEGRVLALVRLHGHPLGLVKATGTAGDPASLCRALVDAAYRELHVPARSTAAPAARHSRVGRARVQAGGLPELPTVSVIVCTRDREAMLPTCLDALMANGYPQTEVILVDNAPTSDAVEQLVRSRYHGRIRYVREQLPGLSRARNRGLSAARGEIVAFTDDDVLTDAGWVTSLVEAFLADDGTGCVTGLVLPAELDTRAQTLIEKYGGPGRGFEARSWSLPTLAEDPLARFSTGRFGAGANMAFRTDVLRAIGGFDPAVGTGTPSRGGEDLLAFLQVLTAGHTITYQPEAIVWHRHRRTMPDLARQVQGFGIGFGAYLAAAVAHRPSLLAELLRRLPYGIWRWRASHRTGGGPTCPEDTAMRRLRQLECRGFMVGPFAYGFTLWQQRRSRNGG